MRVLASRSRVQRVGCVHRCMHLITFPHRVLPKTRKKKRDLEQRLSPVPPRGLKIKTQSDGTPPQREARVAAGRVPRGPTNKPRLQVGSHFLVGNCRPNQLTNVLRALRTTVAAGLARSQVLLSVYIQIYPHADTYTYTNNFMRLHMYTSTCYSVRYTHTRLSQPLSPVIYYPCTLPMVSTYSQLLFQSQTARHASFFGNHVPGISLM